MNKNKKEVYAFLEWEILKLSRKTGIPMYLKKKWYEMSWWEWTLTIIFAPIITPFAFIYLIWGFLTMIPAMIYWGCSSFWNLHLGGKG